MKHRTVPVKVPKRQTKERRLQDFDALADFANLGDEPVKWTEFRWKHPNFFPESIANWIYLNAETCRKGAVSDGAWNNPAPDPYPPLLLYREMLRAIWNEKDKDGTCLNNLLGFDAWPPPFLEKGNPGPPTSVEIDGYMYELPEHRETIPVFMWKGRTPKLPEVITTKVGDALVVYIDQEGKDENGYGFPKGIPMADGRTGIIKWEFACQFQSSVYHLIQEGERWRARRCGYCSEYFVADKGARWYCSPGCYKDKRKKEGKKYYSETEKPRRQQLKAKRSKARSKKSRNRRNR